LAFPVGFFLRAGILHCGRIPHSKGTDRAQQESDPGAIERILRRRVRRPHHGVGLRTASAGASHIYGVTLALAHMAKLRSELSVYRHRLGKSPSSHALCHRDDLSSDVVQFRASLFGVAASALHRLVGFVPPPKPFGHDPSRPSLQALHVPASFCARLQS
jgi:hypothetical protein